MKPLMTSLGHTFKNSDLLTQALTHRSRGEDNNERLEFLGDALLNVIISQKLFDQCPDASEGELTRLRSQLVNGRVLAQLALELGIDQFVLLGMGEKLSGGHQRASILADTLEAIMAAIYLDSDLAVLKICLLQWYGQRLQLSIVDLTKDPKTILQEYLQAHKKNLPLYTLLKTIGKSHEQIFYVQCAIPECHILVEGQALSRRIAEQKAAKKALELLGEVK